MRLGKLFFCLKSNMGAGRIHFLMVTDYLYVSHPSIEKISRLTLQNSLRFCMNFPEAKSDPAIQEMLRVYSSGLSIWREPVQACTPKSQNFDEKCSQASSSVFWAALPGAQPWKGLRPQDRKYYMTRRAFLSSKSNTCAGEIEIKMACQKVIKIDHKNEDISESVSSCDF